MFTPGRMVLTAEGVVWAGAIAYYLVAVRSGGRSEGTVRLHRYYLDRLARAFPRPWDVTTQDLQAFLADPGWAPETRKSARTVVRGFYRWGHGIGYVREDPAAGLVPVRVPPGVARPAPEHVVAQALRNSNEREQLMVMLAALGGLRCAEIARVHARDLVGDVLVVHGKGGRAREVPILSSGLLARLEGVRAAAERGEGAGWAFPGPNGHLSPGHVSRLLSSVLPPGWTGHTLRHRLATQAYAGTRDLLAVSELLGHSRPETTRRYVRLPDDAVRSAVASAAIAGSASA